MRDRRHRVAQLLAHRIGLALEDPLVLHRLLRSHAQLGLLDKQPAHKVNRLGRGGRPARAEARLRRQDALDLLLAVTAMEWAATGEQDEGDDAERPHVAGGRVGVAQEHLGRHVREGAHAPRHRLHLAAPTRSDVAQPEIDELELGVLGRGLVHEIVQLDVAVHHVVLVAVEQRREHLRDEPGRIALRQASILRLLHQLVDELTTRAQLEHHDDLTALVVLIRLEEPHNVGVVEPTHSRYLTAQLFHPFHTHLLNIERLDRVAHMGAPRDCREHGARHARAKHYVPIVIVIIREAALRHILLHHVADDRVPLTRLLPPWPQRRVRRLGGLLGILPALAASAAHPTSAK